MKDELLGKVKEHYEDYKEMVDTSFSELEEENIRKARYSQVNRIREKHSRWVTSEDIDIYDCVLDEAIDNCLGDRKLGKTNGLLLYVSELNYETYLILFGKDISVKEDDLNAVYVLYMNIENNRKFFVKKEEQDEFEEKHNIVHINDEQCVNPGWVHSCNMRDFPSVKRDFIKTAMYEGQDEASKILLKRYAVSKEENNNGDK